MMSSPRLLILTWHSIRVLANTAEENDLIAFSEALDLIDRLGWTILPLAEALQRLHTDRLPGPSVVLTLDDGSIMDFHDFDHPSCGRQISIFHRLQAFARRIGPGSRHHPHASSFVIASPQARQELDRNATLQLGVWPEDWWAAANASGLMSVESHSWDHNHESIDSSVQRENQRGDFRLIETEAECRAEVDQASAYIERISGRRPQFFAYPYGQYSDYLALDYLPRHGERLGLQAALTCRPEPVSRSGDRWRLPRYVCGHDWSSTESLRQLLLDVT